MSLVLLCRKRGKEKKRAQRKKLWPKSRKTAVEMWKKWGKRKESGSERSGSPSQMKLMKIKTDRNQPDFQKKTF